MVQVKTLPAREPARTLAHDVLEGLLAHPRSLPPKYFYDARGSELFDQICDAPEYYPTRAEAALLRQIADEVVAAVRPSEILELGSGAARKTRILFDACERHGIAPRYVPFDVCAEMLAKSGRQLLDEYPWLKVTAVAGDYTCSLEHLPTGETPRLWAFLGGTIGNFAHDEAVTMLASVRAQLRPGDRLLIGADRVKAPEVLHAAYNDEAGVTAAFNLNLINVLNSGLDADICMADFHHYACFNPRASQIEMYLVANRDLSVPLAALDARLEMLEGEAILTEISRKFTRRTLEELLEAAGFVVEAHHELSDTKFSLVLAQPA